MPDVAFTPPWLLKNGFLMTLFAALRAGKAWENTIAALEPTYREHIFTGAQGTPIFGLMAQPEQSRGTIIGTYGITGTLENQWYLRLFGRKAVAHGYGVVLFDWRGHGKTADLSPALTSDGIYEGEDFVRLAAQAKTMGFSPPFWFAGYSLGGQLALWGVKAAQTIHHWGEDLGLTASDLAGAAVICPSVESNQSLTALRETRRGRIMERAIVKQLRLMVQQIAQQHPGSINQSCIDRVKTIRGFDHELVIQTLGFATTADYYEATSPLYFLPKLEKPTCIIYAADDPMFDPTLVSSLMAIAEDNSAINMMLTAHGGHVGYVSSKQCQKQFSDPDRWWAWNRILDWLDAQSSPENGAAAATGSSTAGRSKSS